MLLQTEVRQSSFFRVKSIHLISSIVVVLTAVVSGVGLFYSTKGQPFDFTNQYGDVVKIYGNGLYAHDSFFRAPIFRGTDFIMFFVSCPLLIVSLVLDVQRSNLKTRLLLISLLSPFCYYATSIAFGVTYNFLQLAYIFLFSVCFFAMVAGIRGIFFEQVEKAIQKPLPNKGISVFMVLTGIALFGAWLPDIISSLLAKRSLLMIENYTTEITYVLDMGIIAPSCFICLSLLKKKKGLGYILLDQLLTLCIIVGIILPVQTFFQLQAGIEFPIAAIISKVVIFCLLAVFALYFKIRFWKSIVEL